MSDKRPNQPETPFLEQLMGLLEWVADRDPLTAARLLSDWHEEAAEEKDLGEVLPDPSPA